LTKTDYQTGQTKKHKLEGSLFFLQDTALSKAKLILSGIEIVRNLSSNPDVTAAEVNEKLSKLANLSMSADAIEKEASDYVAALRPDNLSKAIAFAHYDYGGKSIRMRGAVLEEYISATNWWVTVADLSALP
jgi:hypothetical protein